MCRGPPGRPMCQFHKTPPLRGQSTPRSWRTPCSRPHRPRLVDRVRHAPLRSYGSAVPGGTLGKIERPNEGGTTVFW